MAIIPSSLVTWIGAIARAQPGRPALIYDNQVWSYQDMWHRSGDLARTLMRDGLKEGDAVGIIGLNDPYYVINYFAIMRAGGTAVPINVMLDATAALAQLHHVDATRVFVGAVDPAVRDALEDEFVVLSMRPHPDETVHRTPRLPAVGPQSACAIMLTSGTTGQPKGVVHSQSTMLHGALQLANVFPFSQHDRGVVFLPLHACLPEQVLPTLCSGGSLEIVPKFELDRVADACGRATTFDAVPTVLSRLIANAPLEKLKNLQWVLFASERMPTSLLRQWWEELPGVEMHQFYGMTEALTLTAAPHRVLRAHPTTVGLPFPTTHLSIERSAAGDGAGIDGEILGYSPAVMKGYYHDPAATKAAVTGEGAMRTGDVGHVDEDGLLYLTGRQKDIIISGGINIAPGEIEAVAADHPAIESVTVVGIPSATWGETPIVIAVARQGASVTSAQLLEHCRSRLAGYKRPTGAALVPVLPTTGIGKASKERIKQMIIEGAIDVVRV